MVKQKRQSYITDPTIRALNKLDGENSKPQRDLSSSQYELAESLIDMHTRSVSREIIARRNVPAIRMPGQNRMKFVTDVESYGGEIRIKH